MQRSKGIKKSYEFVDIASIKQRERELEIREEKEATKVFKVCKKCQVRKPIYQFSRDKRLINGRTNVCKVCRIKIYLEYYYKNRDRILIKNRRYSQNNKRDRNIYYKNYQEKNRKKLQKLASEWYQANKKAIKKRNLQYYNNNKEACLARRKLWVENNREKIRLYNSEYKRKIKGGLKR